MINTLNGERGTDSQQRVVSRPISDSLYNPAHPIQFRLPKAGTVDPWFGCNRSFWNEQILPTPRNNWTPTIRTRIVRRLGAKNKAIRFIIWESAAAFFKQVDKTTRQELESIRREKAAIEDHNE